MNRIQAIILAKGKSYISCLNLMVGFFKLKFGWTVRLVLKDFPNYQNECVKDVEEA